MGKRVYSIITTLSLSISTLVPIDVYANDLLDKDTINIENNLIINNIDEESNIESGVEDENNNVESNLDTSEADNEKEEIDHILNNSYLEEIREQSLEQENTYQISNQIDISGETEKISSWILANIKNPGYEDEWKILGLSRSGLNNLNEYYEKYYKNLEAVVKEKQGNMHRVKYTEYSRIIIALTSIGKDPTNVGGYNLVEKLYDYDKVSKQGVNGTIFALIALDTKEFEIPLKANNSRAKLIDGIISNQLPDGGFNLTSDKGDADITAMAIQALAKYKNEEKVNVALEKAINFLSSNQLQSGGYGTNEGETVESSSQVLVALSTLGIDVNDDRFVKNDKTIIDAIARFKFNDGGFKHLLTDVKSNSMATEQVMYALVSYDRAINKRTSLYDMNDVSYNENNTDNNLDLNNDNNLENSQDSVNQDSVNQDSVNQNNSREENSSNKINNNKTNSNNSKVNNPKTSDTSILGFIWLSLSSIFGLVLINRNKAK